MPKSEKTGEMQQKMQEIYEVLNEGPRIPQSGFIAPILSDSNQAAAADEQENKAGQP